MQIAFFPQPHIESMVCKITLDHPFAVQRLYEALKDGRLDPGPYAYLDGEIDDDGVSWINAEIEGTNWIGVDATEEANEVNLSMGLKYDPLDGTLGPIMDPEAYWLDFLAPMKKVLAIVQ